MHSTALPNSAGRLQQTCESCPGKAPLKSLAVWPAADQSFGKWLVPSQIKDRASFRCCHMVKGHHFDC